MGRTKIIDNGYIVGVGYGYGEQITETEYDDILATVNNRPTEPTGFAYKLKADTLEWELVELPPFEEDTEATESDYIDALKDVGIDIN